MSLSIAFHPLIGLQSVEFAEAGHAVIVTKTTMDRMTRKAFLTAVG
jgi:hypothetical protein